MRKIQDDFIFTAANIDKLRVFHSNHCAFEDPSQAITVWTVEISQVAVIRGAPLLDTTTLLPDKNEQFCGSYRTSSKSPRHFGTSFGRALGRWNHQG